MKQILCFVLFLSFVGSTQAAGFRVALQSAQQLGMGHTGAGLNLGAESIFFNPGAVAMNDKGDISVSGSAIFASNSFNTPGSTYTADLVDNVGTPFALYASHKFNENWAAGLGVYTPYGNTVEWESDWAGRFINQSIDLASIFIQPTVSYKINDQLGVGAGFIYQLGAVELQRAIQLTPAEVRLKSDDLATGIGFNLGVYYEPTENLSLGINYRSQVDAELEDGTVSVSDNLPNSFAPFFTATQFDAELPLPAELTVGAGVQATEKLLISGDINYTFWSEYEVLTFNYTDGVLGGSTTTAVPQEWDDSFTFRVGGQYDLNEKFDLRGGAYYDFSPVPDRNLSPITPDTDRLGLTAGLSFAPSEKFSIDGSLLYINGDERTVQQSESSLSFGQRYKVTSTIPSLGLNYSFK